jgi:hypothetical protein
MVVPATEIGFLAGISLYTGAIGLEYWDGGACH